MSKTQSKRIYLAQSLLCRDYAAHLQRQLAAKRRAYEQTIRREVKFGSFVLVFWKP